MRSSSLVPSALFGLAALIAGGTDAFAVDIPAVITFDGQQPIEAEIAKTLGGQVQNGKLSVDSTNAQNGLKTAYALDGAGVHAAYVDVEIAPNPDPNSPGYLTGAGLVMKDGIVNNVEGYIYVVVTSDGFVLHTIYDGKVTQELTGKLTVKSAPGQPVRVSARENGDAVLFFINGEPVTSVFDANVLGHGMGAIYFGRGKFVFDNLSMNTTGDIGAAAQPATTTPSTDTQPTTPPATTASAQYYVSDKGQTSGPMTFDHLVELLKTGAITPDTYVWKQGMAAWAAAKTLPEITALVPAPQ
jgi:hypothetical protein